MEAAVIDEFSRIGGGQVLSKLLLNYFNKRGDETYMAVDKIHNHIDYKNIIVTPYVYKENMSTPLLYYSVIKTKNFLKKYNNKNKFDFIFNNHPNMFIYNGNINMLHGFSFLDAIIDEYGNIKNKVVFELIKKSGIYNVYNHANFLVNSEYTYNLSKKMFPLLGIKPDTMEILYIPVTVNKNVDLSLKDKKLVISIGRIDVRKNYEQLIEIAKKLSDYKFVIAGALNSGDEDYYKNLIKNKSSNLEIKINISEEEKIDLLKKASIYVHLNRREHYGISILEAMSYGLIPVVPEVGGPWIDIINKGEYGYGFKNIDEAVNDIKNVDFGIINNMINSLERFSYDRFNIRINDTVSDVIKT